MVEENTYQTLRASVRAMLEAAWREPGFCVPNPTTYPHQWLWDSCFHSLIWLALDDERSLVELQHVLAEHDPQTGFVPHMTYWTDPAESESFWGCRATSSITQPPMFGHTAAELVAAGIDPGPELLATIELALHHLLVDRPRTAGGLVPVYHPWETGCDDSLRWDGFRRDDRTWRDVKHDLVVDVAAGGGLRAGEPGPVGARQVDPFVVGSIGFNALVAWNTRRFLSAGETPSPVLVERSEELAAAIAKRWDGDAGTWFDDGPPTNESSAGIRTLDTMLALLVDPRDEAFDQLVDPAAFGAPFGPCGVHRAEPHYDPTTYWRGPAWPQLTYLLWCAATQAGRVDIAQSLATNLIDGAVSSELAEYWHPDTGLGQGARPQTWAGLGLVVMAAG